MTTGLARASYAEDEHPRPLLSVIIPVFNEAATIRGLYSRILRSGIDVQTIFVDDGSDDLSSQILADLSQDRRVTVLVHQRNFGKGAAIRSALPYASGVFTIIQDADLEYDPKDYARFISAFAGSPANVVYGVRPDEPRRGAIFYLGAKLLTQFTNLLFRVHLHDEATGFKAFRTEYLRKLPLRCKGFEFCPEVTGKSLRRGELIAEIPISYSPRTIGNKKITVCDGFVAIITLILTRVLPVGHDAPAVSLQPFPLKSLTGGVAWPAACKPASDDISG